MSKTAEKINGLLPQESVPRFLARRRLERLTRDMNTISLEGRIAQCIARAEMPFVKAVASCPEIRTEADTELEFA